MRTTAAHPLCLHVDEILAAARMLGIQSLPSVLSLRLRYRTIDEREAALSRARGALEDRGLVVADEVEPDLADQLQALQRPNREIAMRWVTPQGTSRISLVRRGSVGVVVRRLGAEVALRDLGGDASLRACTVALLAELPAARPADIESVGGPLREVTEQLSDTHAPADLTDRIRALGASPHAAAVLGAALSTRQAFAEIVCHTLVESQGTISRVPSAVAVFYTKRGRVIAVPSVSDVGQLWTTLKAGTDQAFGQAIGQLVDLSGERWESY